MITRVHVRLAACLALLTALGACGSSRTEYHAAKHHYDPTRYYPPPGPRNDPWGPYIREASGRFNFPEQWVRRVMRQESGGQEDVISWAGAMGLMQVMPDTYDGLRGRYNLGEDPFDPHNNILAGTAYLKEMYDRFGAPGFLAAYNAGPNRLDSYLNSGRPLPAETVNYVASIAPLLGSEVAMSGPLSVYAGRSVNYASMPASRPTPGVCDPDAAYDPARPCAPMRAPVVVATTAAPVVRQGECDPDAAYDPSRPCWPAAIAAVAQQAPPARAYPVESRPAQERMTQLAAFTPGVPPGPAAGRWGIQVGAFASLATAQAAAERARATLPELLQTAKMELPATTPFGSQVAFRARLLGLAPAAAADACSRLSGRGIACITVPPARDSF